MISRPPELALIDRDGTLIDVVRDEETGAITTAFHPAQIRLLDGVLEGLRLLVETACRLAIVTNQPGPAKGHFSADAVRRTNAALVERLASEGLPIAHVGVCMHHPQGGAGGDPALVGPCDCRKPKPGLLLRAMQTLGADPRRTWMIGDSRADLEAGRAAGVPVGLIFAANRCELCPLRDGLPVAPDQSAARLDLLVRAILAQGKD